MTSAAVTLDDSDLTLPQLDALWDRPLTVQLAPAARERLRAGRAVVERLLADGRAYYGINTGFGALASTRIPPDSLDRLQENLILSHAVGVGEPVPDAIVRWMMLFKIHALAKGHSGVREQTVDALAAMLSADVLPVIPSQGSLGASGDLAPLAHMVLAMMGLGEIRHGGRLRPAAEGLAIAGVKPVRLAAKEGLALINGTQFMTAHGAALLVRARRLCRHADVIAACSLEGLRGSIKPFDERLHRLRPFPGAVAVAANVRRLMAGSEILLSHADCPRVQDPYSLRCVPQVHGACRDALAHAEAMIVTDINSVTDNPVLFDDGTVISGGHFHGEPDALALDYAAMAIAELASIAERRVYLLLSGHDGLPALLMRGTGVNSGFMLPQYTAAALVAENKVLCHPACVDSIPTSLGQEDHVSMGATSAVKAMRVLDNAETVAAVELMTAAQAMDYRAPLRPGVGPAAAHAEIRTEIPHAEGDRLFGRDIAAGLSLLRSGRVLRAAGSAAGELQ
jgi:histidine ammonia-lyase